MVWDREYSFDVELNVYMLTEPSEEPVASNSGKIARHCIDPECSLRTCPGSNFSSTTVRCAVACT